MKVAIHQPDYMPWLGYFYKMSLCDKFVFLDDAQYSTDNIHNWNRIKTPQGELRIKIPVEQKLGYKILEVRTKDELKWKIKHLKNIESFYKRAPFFQEIFPQLETLFKPEYSNLADMNIEIIKWFANHLGITAKFYRSSDFHLNTKREEHVIDICVLLDADVYLSGQGAKAYQIEDHFTDKGIQLKYINFKQTPYEQLWGKDFLPSMSALDYVMNCGFDLTPLKWTE